MNHFLSSDQLLSCVWLFVTPWTVACQASLSNTNSWGLLKLMSIELVTQSNHLILCHPLLLPPSIFPSIRVFSNESVLCIRWPKYWSFSFSISPSNEYSGLIPSGLTGLISLQSKTIFYISLQSKTVFYIWWIFFFHSLSLQIINVYLLQTVISLDCMCVYIYIYIYVCVYIYI